MSLEECRKLYLKERGRRKASGYVSDTQVTIYESRGVVGLPFRPWMVTVRAYGEYSFEHFYRKKSADEYFDKLVLRYDLKETED